MGPAGDDSGAGIAATWGADAVVGDGKVVWCELRAPDAG